MIELPKITKKSTIYPNGGLLNGKVEGNSMPLRSLLEIAKWAKNGSLIINYDDNMGWTKTNGQWSQFNFNFGA